MNMQREDGIFTGRRVRLAGFAFLAAYVVNHLLTFGISLLQH